MKRTISTLICLLGFVQITFSQSNSFPLFANGNYSGGSGDYTNITNAQLKLQSPSGYVRVNHISYNSVVSTVYNFETGKNAYWGEPSDQGNYLFRGRNLIVEQSNLGIRTTSPNALIDAKYPGVPINIYRATDQNDQYRWRVDQNFDMYLTNASGSDFVKIGQSSSWFNSGNFGIGTTTPNRELHVVGTDAKIQVEGSTAGAISLKHGGFINNPIYEWQSLSGRFRLNYIDDTVVKADLVTISNSGDVGIGTDQPDAKLTVKGDIHTQEVTVDLQGAVAPDFVFEEDYDLKSLEETEEYIQTNKHLPEIPSAAEMEENGFELKEMNLKLLQKVEELTLHLIEQNKINKAQEDRIAELERKLEGGNDHNSR